MTPSADRHRVRGRSVGTRMASGGDRTAAMTAWEIESRLWGAIIQPLSSHAKRVLCLDAIGLFLASFRPSLAEAPTARLARRVLDLLRQQADDYSAGEPGGAILDGLCILRAREHSPPVASMVRALTAYADAMVAGLEASSVLVIMSACCEAVLYAEPGNQTLTHLIAAQRRLVNAASLV